MWFHWEPSGRPPNPNEDKIRRLYRAGLGTKELSERFGLSIRRVQVILGAELKPRSPGVKAVHIPGRQTPAPAHPWHRRFLPLKKTV